MFKAIKHYFQITDLVYLLLCLGCTVLSVLTLISIGKYELGGFAMDEVEGIVTGLGGYKQAVVQAAASLIGIALAILISLIDYRSLAKLWPIHAAITWGMVLLTIVFHEKSFLGITLGHAPVGTQNYSWIVFPGGISLQPTELAKISFILMFAMHLETQHEHINEPPVLAKLLLHLLIAVGVIHIQGDDGTAIVFTCIGCMMLFVAGLSWKYTLGAAAIGVTGLALVLTFFQDKLLHSYQISRIMAVIAPETVDPKFTYQQNQGKVSIGSGKIVGRGLFGEQHHTVANAHNDFIFSYIAESVGFIGSVILIGVLVAIAVRTLSTGMRSKDRLGTYICVGVFAAIAWQVVINLGMNLGVLPVIGVTLPFLSAGGTSALMMYLSVGLVLSVYTHNKRTLFGKK